MQILPMTLALLLIFSISTQAILKKAIVSKTIHSQYHGYMNASRMILNEKEKALFDNAPKKKKEPIPGTEHPPKYSIDQKQKKSIALSKVKLDSRIPIYSLFTDNPNEEVYDIFAHLIAVLYKKSSLFKNSKIKDLEYLLVDTIIKEGKEQLKNNDPLCLEKIKCKKTSLLPIYYKMLKGTKHYDFNRNIGYPSLLDYISIKTTKDKPQINVPFAPKELLTTLFDEKIAEEINKSQWKDKFYPINKEQLEQIFSNNNFSLKNTNLWQLFDFPEKRKKNYAPENIQSIDKKTQICIKKKVFLRD